MQVCGGDCTNPDNMPDERPEPPHRIIVERRRRPIVHAQRALLHVDSKQHSHRQRAGSQPCLSWLGCMAYACATSTSWHGHWKPLAVPSVGVLGML